MIRNGDAWVYQRYLKDQNLLALQSDAKAQDSGLWGLSEAENVPPWEWRRNGDSVSYSGSCLIKGNINSKGEHIYHVPGTSSYGDTKIDQSKGERWFCSENEARTNGWRAPRN
jgi:hypothetical protein